MHDNSGASRKILLDANPHSVNAMDSEKMISLITNTLDTIYGVLREHCGPDAKLTLQTDASGSSNRLVIPALTNDGISIVRNMEFLNPLQQRIAQVIAYVGERVDMKAHDGTTTSMMFAARFLSGILSTDFTDTISGFNKKTFINTFMDMFLEQFMKNPQVIKGEDILTRKSEWGNEEWSDTEAYNYLISRVVDISSKGNTQLAECVKEVFKDIPIELVGDVHYFTSPVEIAEPFSVMKTEDNPEFILPAMARTDTKYFKDALGTQYINPSVDVIISPDDIGDGYDFTNKIMDHISNPEREGDLVIICGKHDPRFMGFVDNFNAHNETKCFIFTAPIPGGTTFRAMTHLQIINASGKVHSPYVALQMGYNQIERSIHKNISFKYRYGNVELSNVYKAENVNSYNPRYTKKDFVPYTELMDTLSRMIDREENLHNPNLDNLRYWKSVYADGMCWSKPPALVVGGTSMTAQANIDVVEDVLGSVVSVIKDGFVINGINAIVKNTNATRSELKGHSDAFHLREKMNNGITKLAECFHDTGIDIIGRVLSCDSSLTKDSDIHPDAIIVREKCPNGIEYYSSKVVENGSKDMLIQPLSGYIELFKRIKEIGTNFIGLYQVQMTGAVLIEKDEERRDE